MTLVRVYCGLASADPGAGPVTAEPALVAAVVDDAGRLLDVCEIADAPAGYATLAAILVARSSGPSGTAVAADRADHAVTSLLTAAGSSLAIVDDEAVADYAERFADDGSVAEVRSPAAVGRAVGLARALQAGAISALNLPTPRELVGYRPVLGAHAALAHGRYAAAAALREVLRELYPAALRAYSDPAEPVSLAVLDALPEPGMLGGAGRGPEVEPAVVVAQLARDRMATEKTVGAAVTALRVAVSDTHRQSTTDPAIASAVAEAVRQAVAAVRACDAASEALVATLVTRVASSAPPAPGRVGRRAAAAAAAAPAASTDIQRVRPNEQERSPGRRTVPEPAAGRRTRSQPAAVNGIPVAPRPLTPSPVAPPPVAPPPVAPSPRLPGPVPAPSAPPAHRAEPMARPVSPVAAHTRENQPVARPVSAAAAHTRENQPVAPRPVSAPPPPPPGITPIVPAQRSAAPPPFGESIPAASAAVSGTRAERQRPTPISPRPRPAIDEPSPSGSGAAGYAIPVPVPRPAAPQPAPGSRASWPLVSSSDERDADPVRPYGATAGPNLEPPADPLTASRVTPPWLADDLPPEPPMLRLVEPPPLADRALRGDRPQRDDDQAGDNPPLRLVDAEPDRWTTQAGRDADERNAPVSAEHDEDLLIFAEIRSAWFTGPSDESAVKWESVADSGWEAAEHAAEPAVGDETGAGLPRRVPQANLVPGSPLRDERPLRIVRDPERIAAHTTGYFRGYRRGQEIGGYAVGGRPGRQAAGGWDFTREQADGEEADDFGYRSAGYRS